MNEKETALATMEGDETPNHLIALALDKQANPDTLSKLMDLQERWERNQAHKAYVAAMTAFKQEAPAVLEKNDVVDFTTGKGRTNYRYANLGSIVQQITACMGKHELSASWSTEQNGKDVTVTCHITHVGGHRESVTLTGPIDESGNKNQIQAVGSTVTYLQRYTLLAALGLATGEDDDGRGGNTQTSEPAQTNDQYPCPECVKAGREGYLIVPPEAGEGERQKPAKCSLSHQSKNSEGKWVEDGKCKFKTWDKKLYGQGGDEQPEPQGDIDEETKMMVETIEMQCKQLHIDGKQLGRIIKEKIGCNPMPLAKLTKQTLIEITDFLDTQLADNLEDGEPIE